MNRGKNNPAMTYDEMIEAGEQQRKTSKLYKAEASRFVDGQLSSLIEKTTTELQEAATTAPVSLSDINTVKARTILYLRACQEASCFPSISGLARSMGLSRQALYDVMWRRSPSATAAWLEVCRDTFSDILAESALRNNANSITAIFLQKALYGLRETNEFVIKSEQNMELSDENRAELQQTLMEKYAELPED